MSLYRSVSFASAFALVGGALFAQSLFVKPVKVLGDPHYIGTASNPTAADSAGPNVVEGRELQQPSGVALDTTVSPPILYVADSGNNRVLAFQYTTQSKAGSVADLIIGQPDQYTTLAGGSGGLTTALRFPTAVVVDASGNLYVSDNGNNRVVRYPKPFAQPAGYQFPDLVIGQTSYSTTAANSGGIKASTLSLSTSGRAGLAIDSSANLWVADTANNRVLRFPASVLKAGQNGPSADLAVGQQDLVSSKAATARNSKIGLTSPTAVAFDASGRLLVSDAFQRVLVYPAGVGLNAPANRILGVDATTSSTAGSAITIGAAQGVGLGGNSVVVADNNNNRLLVFDRVDNWPQESTQFSPTATAVIGQSNFTAVLSNAGNGDAGAGLLSLPVDVTASSSELYVADAGNNRVLVFPINNGAIGQTASRVIGQLDFPYRAANLIEGKEFYTNQASGVIVDASSTPPHLYVADSQNNRVLGFKDFTHVVAGQKADLVIGQPDFFRAVINYPSGKATTPNAQGLNFPTGLAIDSAGNLYVADTLNSRVVRFPAPFASGVSALQTADLVLGQSSFTAAVTDATQRSLSEPIGLALTKDGLNASVTNAGWLAVTDLVQNRVLFFPKPFTSGMNASIVLGQSSFTGSAAAVTSAGLSGPGGVAVDPQDRVLVADTTNGRIQVYPAVSTLAATSSPASFSITNGLSQPLVISVESSGQFWVADPGVANGLLHFASIDQLPIAVPPYSSDISQPARLPRSVFADAYNNLLVADNANRILYFAPQVNIANAANYIAGRELAPGAFASLFANGTNVLSSGTAGSTALPLPTVLSDTQVIVNGVASALSYVSPAQINLPLSFNLPSAGTVDLQVVRQSTGQIYGGAEVSLAPASPGLFVLGGLQSGPVAAQNQDFSLNTATNPVARGTVIQLFGTGQGPVPNPPADGTASSGLAPTAATPQVVLGASGSQIQVPVGNIQYSGLAPGFVGLWQINVLIPANAPSGNNVPITVYMNSIPSSNAAVPAQVVTTISVK